MKKRYVVFLFLLMPFLICAMDGVGELQVFGSADREREVDSLMDTFFASDTLPEAQRALLKKRLIALKPDEYLAIVAQIQGRGAEAPHDEANGAEVSHDEPEKDDLVKVLFAIVSQLDKHNEFMEQQVGQFERFNDAQDEDGDREEEAHELAKAEHAFTKYSWKVGTALGVLGTAISTAMAIWQGDVATQCVNNSTA
jgi:Na+-transporting methylmalonyl-CoA/oxaloacetate decarboxylase gamma subunit